MDEFADVLNDLLEVMLLAVALFTEKLQELHVDREGPDDEVGWHIQRVIHLLHCIHRSLDVFRSVTQSLGPQEVYEALVIAIPHKLIVRNDEACPRHVEDVNLIADEASKLTSCIIASLLPIMIKGHWLNCRPDALLTETVTAEQDSREVVWLLKLGRTN